MATSNTPTKSFKQDNSANSISSSQIFGINRYGNDVSDYKETSSQVYSILEKFKN